LDGRIGSKELGEKVWATEITAQNQPKVVLSKHLKLLKKFESDLMDLNIETDYLKINLML
jgi:16S rRNA (cytosine967-C5)-methyltransferase